MHLGLRRWPPAADIAAARAGATAPAAAAATAAALAAAAAAAAAAIAATNPTSVSVFNAACDLASPSEQRA